MQTLMCCSDTFVFLRALQNRIRRQAPRDAGASHARSVSGCLSRRRHNPPQQQESPLPLAARRGDAQGPCPSPSPLPVASSSHLLHNPPLRCSLATLPVRPWLHPTPNGPRCGDGDDEPPDSTGTPTPLARRLRAAHPARAACLGGSTGPQRVGRTPTAPSTQAAWYRGSPNARAAERRTMV